MKDENESLKYNPLSLDRIIKYLENTKPESWCEDVVKTKDGKNCVKGHIFDMGGNFFMDTFESLYATDFMIYPVNDGKNENYQQPTPKERVIAYLKNMKEGKEKTTLDYDKEYEAYLKEDLQQKKHLLCEE